MVVHRMDNVGIVVQDLPRMIAFFTELGLELEGEATVEGPWMDGCIDIDDAACDIAMLRTPDGHSKLELSCFRRPETPGEPEPRPVNTYGYLRVMFAVDDLEATLARLRPFGCEVLREVVNYEDVFLLCYVRGPEGLLLGLAQQCAS
jgi:catechol 2,3-dioxygenase-like lactoylglutathione lyase family enzyme